MSKAQHVQAFYVQKLLMILTGLWPKRNSGYWYTLYGFTMSFVLQAIFIMPSLVLVFSKATDVAHGTVIVFSSLTMLAYGVKVIILFAKRNSFCEILNDLKQPLFNNYTNNMEVYMNGAVSISNRTRKLIHSPCIIFMVFLAIFPILENRSLRPLPYEMPINVNKLPFPVYATVYFLELLAAAVATCNNSNIDTLACSFMALGTAQLQMLEKKVKTSAAVCSQQSKKSVSKEQNLEAFGRHDAEVLKSLRKCAKHHIAIAKYVDKLERVFSYMFLAQFLASVVVICLAGFSFIVIPVSNMLFGASISYFAAVMVEISIYCIFGDELMIQSQKISNACYMSEWNNCGPEIRKTLLIMMERSKRPLVLTAGKFVALSRQSLLMLCKSSFSYFAVLRKVYGGEQ